MRHFGSGPLWDVYLNAADKPCQEYWWSSLLYVQNYVNPKSMVNKYKIMPSQSIITCKCIIFVVYWTFMVLVGGYAAFYFVTYSHLSAVEISS